MTVTSSTRFKVPSPEEFAAYFVERGSSAAEAEKCYDHYTANGWKVGRSPMKDWRAAVRNWLRSDSFALGGDAAPAKKMAAPPAQMIAPLPYDSPEDAAAAFRARLGADDSPAG